MVPLSPPKIGVVTPLSVTAPAPVVTNALFWMARAWLMVIVPALAVVVPE